MANALFYGGVALSTYLVLNTTMNALRGNAQKEFLDQYNSGSSIKYSNINELISSVDNIADKINAFEHAYTSANLVYNGIDKDIVINTGIIKEAMAWFPEQILLQNENNPSWVYKADVNRDLWNNNVGVNRAEQAKNNNIDISVLVSSIFNDINNNSGDFITDLNENETKFALDNMTNLSDLDFGDLYNELKTALLNSFIEKTLVGFAPLFRLALQTAPVQIDPLLIDLNGDGIKTTDLANGTYFDHNKDGYAELSAWVDENDGILAYDINGDGVINDGGEIFGDQFVLANGQNATSGFNALKSLDSNSDNIINANDAEFVRKEFNLAA